MILTGPTAVGKTGIAEKIARKIGSRILSFDSRTMYRDMNIGTGKYTLSKDLEYEFIDILEIGQVSRTYGLVNKARELSAEILKDEDRLIICGGSMDPLYRFIKGMDPSPPPDMDLRSYLENEFDSLGPKAMWNKLNAIDPDLAAKVHPNNKKRMVRYLERSSGLTNAEKIPPLDLDHSLILLTMERDALKRRIKDRVDTMLDLGWIDEVDHLMQKGYTPDNAGMDSIGYPEIISYLKGELTLTDMKDLIISSTRTYARRQMNWMKRFDGTTIDMTTLTLEEVADQVCGSM